MTLYSAKLIHVPSGKEYSYSNIVTDDLVRKDIQFDEEGKLVSIGTQTNIRFLLLEDKQRIEFAVDTFLVEWGKERQDVIEANQKAQAAAAASRKAT